MQDDNDVSITFPSKMANRPAFQSNAPSSKLNPLAPSSKINPLAPSADDDSLD